MPLAEFIANNYMLELTSIIPFYANSGRHPRFTIEGAPDRERTNTNKVTSPKKLEREQARNFATRLADMHAKLR